MKSLAFKIAGLTLMFILLVGLTLCYAQAVEKYYRGKTITWVVSAQPGGSTDMVARILGPHLSRATGANVVVKNLTGGSMEGNNWVYNRAKRDGLTLLTEGTISLLLNDFLKSPGVRYKTENFIFVTAVDHTYAAFAVSPKLPYRTLAELRSAKGLKVGASSTKGGLCMRGSVMLEVLGLDGKVITGYKGSRSVFLAVGQGEMDIVVSSEPGIARAEKAGNVVPLFVTGKESPLFPNLPTLSEFGAIISKESEDVFTAVNYSNRAIALPPGVPEERVTFLRKIFKKMNDTKKVQNDMKKYFGSWRPFIPGEKIQETIKKQMANKSLGKKLEAIRLKYAAFK